MGSSHLYDHLVPDADESAMGEDGDGKVSLVQIVCRTLDIKAEDVSEDVPLTSYGLDSLSAASLSFALRPLLSISQLQLLADLTIKDLRAKIEDATDAGTPPTGTSQPESSVTTRTTVTASIHVREST